MQKIIIEDCLLCKYYRSPCYCEHCDSENNYFRLSKEGKDLIDKIIKKYTASMTIS